MNQNHPLRKLVALAVLVVLLIVVALLSVRVAKLAGLTQEEMQRTPTPVPPYGNVLRVTVDPSLPTAPPVLRSGSQGEAVTQLQTRLKELGYYTAAVDGQFGPGTREAVVLFQRQHGLDADGLVGEETRGLLYSEQAQHMRPVPTLIPTLPPAAPASPQTTSAKPNDMSASMALSGQSTMAPRLTGMLRGGSEGEMVTQLQIRLQELGYYTDAVDGSFGTGTRKAVIQFQKNNGLDTDGIVGEATWTQLRSEQAKSAPTPMPLSAEMPGTTANGMPLLVNRTNYLPDQYKTVELVNMSQYCDSSIVTIKADGIRGERVAVDALLAMLRYACNEGIGNWQVSAGYRTISDQQRLFDESVAKYMENDYSRRNAESATRLTVADPGTSEHHLGLAFDITVPGKTFEGTKQAAWLAEHCWEWGFIMRYTKEKESITGYLAEAWHIRYVGTQHSLIMRDKNLCLEEYLEQYSR